MSQIPETRANEKQAILEKQRLSNSFVSQFKMKKRHGSNAAAHSPR